MKLRTIKLVVAVLILIFGPAYVGATPVTMEFKGVISSDIYLGFGSLLSKGDAVYGSVQFGFSPPDAFEIDRPITGGNAIVPSGRIFDFDLEGATLYPDAVRYYFFGGSGPSISIDKIKYTLSGFGIHLHGIDTMNSTLDEYLKLSTDNFVGGVIYGRQDYVMGSVSRPIADISIKYGDIRVANIPEPATVFLILFGLVGLTVGKMKKIF